jgi:hypothetical protein
MVVTKNLELDILDIAIVNFHVREFEVDILIEFHRLKFVGEVIVICNREKAFRGRGGSNIMHDSIHAGHKEGDTSVLGLRRSSTLTFDDG